MDDVLELAAKLSGAIARSSRYHALRDAEKAVMSDEDAVAKLKAREELLHKLAKKEKELQPIEPEEKRELAALDQFVKTHPGLAELSRTQADFQEMMNLVNRQIASALEPRKPEGGADAADEPTEADPGADA